MLTIGELSRVTSLTVKALRLYHEKGLLIPDRIDYDSNYRYYRSSAVDRALVIKNLKEMGFSLEEIKKILLECRDDGQLVAMVETKLQGVAETIRLYQEMKENLEKFIHRAGQEGEPPDSSDCETIQQEVVPDRLMCGIRFKGKYHEVGQRIGTLFKKCGRYAVGKPFTLYYDSEYKEEDADIEACIEVKKEIALEGITCRWLTGGSVVTLLHHGPYPELGRSYQKVFEYCRLNGLETRLPVREEYIKGPGMIFKGNPKKYITKLMVEVTQASFGASHT